MVIGAPLRLLIGLVLLALTIPAVTRIATRAADAVVSVGQRNADAFR
jgi:flagellar biosynthesis protein FliR